MKTCTKCKIPQEKNQFRKDRSTKDGLHPHCRSCFNKARAHYYNLNLEKERATARRSYEKNKHKHKLRRKIYSWRTTYGIQITYDSYEKLLEKQLNKCAICKTETRKLDKLLAVDHCHNTGKVRGLLCSNCNLGIGLLKEDPEILNNAIKYLHEQETLGDGF